MSEAKPSTTGTAVAKVRETASNMVHVTSDTARDLARKTAAGVEGNPVGVLAGGVALGVLIGAFVPRGTQEAKLLGPIGKRLSDSARGAVDAAKDTAKAEFDVLGFSRDAARDQVGRMLGDVVKTLATAGSAAVVAAKAKPPIAETPAAEAPKPAPKKAEPEA